MTNAQQSNAFTIPVGISKKPVKIKLFPEFRTKEQFERVRSISNQSIFDFSCGPESMFDPENTGSTYQGPFCFLWFDTNNKLHITRIGKRGKILQEVSK